MTTQQKGRIAEDKALDYLIENGLKLVNRNFYCKVGEIDLIMRDKAYLVFVEVRARISSRFGGGIGSITYAKQQKIIKASTYYLLKHKIYDKYPLRFDIITIDGVEETITWLKDAFWANY